MKPRPIALVLSLLALAVPTTGQSGGTCGPCTEPGICPATLPMGAGPGEDHRCEWWIGTDLTGADLSSALLSNVLFGADLLPGSDLSGVNFRDSDLSGASLFLCQVEGADFSGADLSGALLVAVVGAAYYDSFTDFSGTGFDPVAAGWIPLPDPPPGTCGPCYSPGACPPTPLLGLDGEDHSCEDFAGVLWFGESLSSADLRNTDFTDARLSTVELEYADLRDAVVVGATLTFVTGWSADFSGADLSLAQISNGSFREARFVGANLSDLFVDSHTVSEFGGCDFTGADLSNADFGQASFHSALGYTRFIGANLQGADLSALDSVAIALDFDQADLTGADLSGTDFSLNSRFRFADLTGVAVVGSDFSGVDFESATGLATTTGSAFFDCETDFTGTGFDPVAAGWVNVDCGACIGATEVVRLGTPPNPNVLKPGLTGPPTAGELWQPWLAPGLPNDSTNLLMLAGGPANLPNGPMGTLLVNPAVPPFELFPPFDGTFFKIPVPDNCAFVGFPFHAQVASVGFVGEITLTNALDCVIGSSPGL